MEIGCLTQCVNAGIRTSDPIKVTFCRVMAAIVVSISSWMVGSFFCIDQSDSLGMAAKNRPMTGSRKFKDFMMSISIVVSEWCY